MGESILEVSLSTPVYGGECLGKTPGGKTVFVPFTLPGERVLVRLVEEKQGYARGEVVDVLSASPDRIKPRCRHFQICGGCHYQHIPYGSQLRIKQQIVVDQLIRIAGISDPPVKTIVPSPAEWNYRNTIQFHLGSNAKLGFLASGSHQVVEIQECFLPVDVLDQTWRQIDIELIPEINRLSIKAGYEDDVLILLEGDSPEIPDLDLSSPVSIVHMFADHIVVLAGADHVWMPVLDRLFRVSAGSFFQVNRWMAEKMVQHICDIVQPKLEYPLVDLYCGVGLFSAFLAPRASRCIGIEMSPAACDDFAYNLKEYEHIELYQGAVEKILPALKLKRGTIIVDPPRTGLDRSAREALIQAEADFLIYVSCDPATLSRDLKYLLAGGYHLCQITPFDLFPQTYHVETVSVLRRGQPVEA